MISETRPNIKRLQELASSQGITPQALELFRTLPDDDLRDLLSLLVAIRWTKWHEAGGEPARLTLEARKPTIRTLLSWVAHHGQGYCGGGE